MGSDRMPLASSLSGVDIVGGHITFDMKYAFNAVPSRRTLFITVMRLPIISLVSGIRYWYPEWSQQETEAAFRRNISTGELTFANAVQYLVNDYATFGDYTSAAYLQAAANLRRFSLVGLQERMNATMLMLQVWLDPDERCRECWVPEKQNPSKGFKPEELLESLSAEERATVDRMLSKENALYDVGQEMFHSTCHSILGSHGDVCGPKPNKTSSAATFSASSIASGALASSFVQLGAGGQRRPRACCAYTILEVQGIVSLYLVAKGIQFGVSTRFRWRFYSLTLAMQARLLCLVHLPHGACMQPSVWPLHICHAPRF